MKLLFTLFSFFLISHSALSQTDFASVYSKTRESYNDKDYPNFITLAAEAVRLRPTHQGALYYAGIASAMNAKPVEAVSFLKKNVLIDARYDLKNPNLASLKDRADFKDVLKLQEELNKPVVNSDTSFTVKDRQLHVEGIAYDPDNKTFYLGSVHQRKIVKVDATGKTSDFIKFPPPEMASIFGIKLDSKRKFLWACSSALPETKDYNSSIPSKVYKYDINGNLMGSFGPPAEVKEAIFGDLVLNKKDEVYVSDSKNNIILKVDESTKSLEIFFKSPQFLNIQGITFSDDNSVMFIADYMGGIYKLDMKTKQLTELKCLVDVSVKGIDGLNFYKGSLIAIQNGVAPLRAVRLMLNSDYTSITNFQTIDRNHPAFNEPTLGTIDGSTLYYIANSQWSGYDDDHTIKPMDQLQDIVILKVDLDKLKTFGVK